MFRLRFQMFSPEQSYGYTWPSGEQRGVWFRDEASLFDPNRKTINARDLAARGESQIPPQK